MTDEHRDTDDFDPYTVDTRRQARWTESRRRPERPAPDDGHDAAHAGADPSVGRTRALPTLPADPARPHRDRTGASPAPRRDRPEGRPPAAPRGASRARPARRRRIRWGRLLALLLLLWLAFLVITPLHAWTTLTRNDTTPAGDRPTDNGGHNYLLLGSDSRVGMSQEERERLGASAADGQRTDSIILVHVPEHGGKSALISIPRDSYVPVPGKGSHKINAAYSLGGARLLTQTLEQVGDIHIDGTMQIGFGGFADVVDSLGGVTLCPERDMKDPEAGIDVKKGCQPMNGPSALGYVRTRHVDPRGDLGRADRQREFLGAVMKSAVSPVTVLLPWRYWGFTHAAAGSVGMSDNLGPSDVARVLTAMRGTGSGDTLSLMMPIASIGYPTREGSAVKWNTEQARELFRLIREDTPMTEPPAGTHG